MKPKLKISQAVGSINLLEITEDLTNEEGLENKTHPEHITPMDCLLQKEIRSYSKQLQIEEEELQAWLEYQVNVPHQTLLHLLRTAQEYALDLLKEEVLLTKYEDQWQISISIDGWIKLLHRHPAFSGLSFTESPEQENKIPAWIECTIYRSDQMMPMAIREYWIEVQNEGDIWKKMPRRMLRHRALQQCARLALGINPSNTISPNTKSEIKIEPTLDNPSASNLMKNALPQSEKLKTFLKG